MAEERHPDPQDHYGMSKLGAELYSQYMAARLGVELAILRIGYVYGPNDGSGKVVQRFLRGALSGQDLEVTATAGVFRDYVFVDDVVRCLLGSASPTSPCTRVVNVSSGVATTPLEVAAAALDASG
jgi:nucleoside-diphosphate-sugar epimerase